MPTHCGNRAGEYEKQKCPEQQRTAAARIQALLSGDQRIQMGLSVIGCQRREITRLLVLPAYESSQDQDR